MNVEKGENIEVKVQLSLLKMDKKNNSNYVQSFLVSASIVLHEYGPGCKQLCYSYPKASVAVMTDVLSNKNSSESTCISITVNNSRHSR